ncbi:DNA-binding transcriptional activator DecR [Candidatus Erwinia haradaeae]|uniref:DNA-binding transcriptional activator DecR n=2 Tax=Candidatus Erwinia haradaeae TaxID=1922217 RepID=A0A451D4P6_9GAMM|nr:DNA-binding transcriptional activator DecR [Candidatus Erwinia haradaeae]
MLPIMLDKKDRLLLNFLQQDCTLSLQVLAEHICLTTTPCWKRLKRLEDEGYIRARVALLDSKKLGLDVTVFVLIKTNQHSRDWFYQFVSVVKTMPEVMGLYRMAGEYDYFLRVQVANIKSYDIFYKKLLNGVPALLDVTSSFAMEEIKYTTALPVSI